MAISPKLLRKSSLNRRLPYLFAGLAVIIILNLLAVSYPLYVLLPLMKALFLAVINFIYGYALLSVSGRGKSIHAVTAFSLGMMVTAFLLYILSLFKLLVAPVLGLYFIIPLLLIPVLKKNKDQVMDSIRTFFKRPAAEYLVFLVPLVYAALPSSFYDTLAYHLGIPNLYLQNGGFVPTPQLFYANTFIYYEISLIPAVFAGDMAPRLFHFLMGSLLILAAVDFGVVYFNIKNRTMLILVIISMPMTIFLLSAVKNDLPCALFILMGITACYKNKINLSALFWGFAIGIKYTNIVPLAVFVLVQLYLAVKEKRFGPFFKRMIIFGLIAFAVLLPLMLKNYICTGNPVFPFFYKVFDNKISQWDETRLAALEKDAKKLFYSVTDVLKFPLTVSFEDPGSGGRVGPLFLMFLPFLFFVRNKTKWPLLFFSLAVLLTGGHFKLSTRVWYIAFLFLSCYVILAYESLQGPVRKIMTVLLFGAVAFNLFNAFGLHEYLYRSYDLYTGKVSIEEYKANTFPAYTAIRFVNENTPPDAKVLLVGEGRSYYLKRPYTVSSGYDYSILKTFLEHSRSPGEFIDNIKAGGFKFIIFDRVEFQRLLKGYHRLTPEQAQRATGVLNRLPALFDEGGVRVLSFL
jgi:hypothetical protein